MATTPDDLRRSSPGKRSALVPDGAVLGLGSGRAQADTFSLEALAEKCRAGLRVRGVPTSLATARHAEQLGVPLVSLDEVDAIDLALDGADEVSPTGDLIKGYGGAVVREKVVAVAAARRVVILVGPEKLVPVLGSRGRLPVEVIPFAAPVVRRWLAERGYPSELRTANGEPFVSDNGNRIIGPPHRPDHLGVGPRRPTPFLARRRRHRPVPRRRPHRPRLGRPNPEFPRP